MAEQEAQLLAELERGQKKLAGAKEIAEGKVWTESLKTTWRPPKFIRDMTEEEHQAVRDEYHILAEGNDIPPPISNFTVRTVGLAPTSLGLTELTLHQDMKIPKPILDYLLTKGIRKPSPIQMQGLPTA